MEKRLSLFFVCLLMSIGAAFAQIDVSGTVISADDNEPIIGASVLISGGAATKGTVTDIDGKFKLNVPNGTKLVFSYVGMKSQTLAATANMKVVLRPEAQLQEVVVTGIQKTHRIRCITQSHGQRLRIGCVENVSRLAIYRFAMLCLLARKPLMTG